jgi:CobQ-like glutamine amidotransferase family enzyme
VIIEIAWIFPRLLNTYGDGGNILALVYRCRMRGIPTIVHRVAPGSALPRASLILIGGGQDRSQVVAAEALGRLRTPIREAIEDGSVVLGVCAGYQFLGDHYALPGGTKVPGLAVLDVATVAGPERFVGDVVAEPNPLLGLGAPLAGFENHSGRTALGSDADLRPLGTLVQGRGNNGQDGSEGAFKGNVFGTYLHGPVLPNNPALCDLLISRVLQRQGGSGVLAPLDDRVELAAAAAYRAPGGRGQQTGA